jgi:octaprenyl-diphosphate synthase
MKNSGAEAEIRRLVAGIDSNPENPEKIHTFVLENGGIGYAEKRLEDYIAQACKAVSVLPGSEFKDILIGLAEYNALRER